MIAKCGVKKLQANITNKMNIDDYIATINQKCEQKMQFAKKTIKLNDDEIIIPNLKNYYEMTKYNYNVSQLKLFAKTYNLKISGNKKELTTRLFVFLYLSSFIIKIQKVFKGHIQRKYNKIQGPGLKKREICTNGSDFITMEELMNLKPQQFFSYQDEDGFIYGFDISSLYNLIFKNGLIKNGIKIIGGNNPYNRKSISDNVIKNIETFIRLSKILHMQINLEIEDDNVNISNDKIVELQAITLFQTINSLGNYSDAIWFLSLTRNKIIKFIRELMDIWNYRLQLTIETKRSICPPNGDPFRHLNMHYIHTEPNMVNVKKAILDILEKLVNSGVDQYSKSLGAYYILGSLTLVNENAATTLPWLFQSVNHF